ncbi:hypothetical protein [Natrinema altunense]|uniref:Uncharacterized protein n=1 Tax=Natrinema altunense TaxID=222984 RepID=A0A482XZB5_9EURY|nr:hypothetical protein [Natrinema altunense]RZH69109.1 hypothetical protein ELS17_06570 [Natrinema altunense]
MKEKIKIYGSLCILIASVLSGSIALGMFVWGRIIIDTIGLVGLLIEIIVLNFCMIASMYLDIIGNASRAIDDLK